MMTDWMRRSLIAGALGSLMLLSACTLAVEPETNLGGTIPVAPSASATPVSEEEIATPAPEAESATPTPAAEGEAMEGEANLPLAEFILPDGTRCLHAGFGATLAFDDKRVNYNCVAVDASENATETLAILGDPMVVGPTEYFVDLATIARTEGGFELHSSEVISFTAWSITLADGRVCLHAGFGATMGFDGNRLNYTCDKGESTADEVGLMGELTNQGDGVWMAQIDEIGRDAAGFVQLSSTQVAVATISGAEVMPGGESGAAPEEAEMGGELTGTLWQWVETEYGDGSVVVATDPSRYTLLFDETGNVAVQFDCNSGGGPYTVDNSSLTFGALISTLMGCPEGTQDSIFSKDLGEVYSYVIEDGYLYLSMKLDSGIMKFAPAGAETMPTPEATEEVTEEPTAEPTQEPTEEPAEEAANQLAGTSWQWVQSVYPGDVTLAANDSSRYTLTFNEDGSLQAKLDCNNGRGTYTLDGATLSFGPIASTRMGCPADSMDSEFAEDLAQVVAYTLVNGDLHLTLADDGVMEFAPLQ
jgi:heat shock protein HslJ